MREAGTVITCSKLVTYAVQSLPKLSLKRSIKMLYVCDLTGKNVAIICSWSLHFHNRRIYCIHFRSDVDISCG
jgi:hypothetical protein